MDAGGGQSGRASTKPGPVGVPSRKESFFTEGKKMKALFRTVLVSLALVLLVTAFAPAQGRYGVKANVPFEFRILDQVFPAGEYMVSYPTAPHREVVMITNTDGVALRLVQTFQSQPMVKSGEPYLLFHRYGSETFLSQVWTPGMENGRQFPKTRMEKELARTAALENGGVKVAEVLVTGR